MNSFTDIRLLRRQNELQAPAGLSRWELFRHRWETRRQLRDLSADELADIGLSLAQQREEGLKPFWRE